MISYIKGTLEDTMEDGIIIENKCLIILYKLIYIIILEKYIDIFFTSFL